MLRIPACGDHAAVRNPARYACGQPAAFARRDRGTAATRAGLLRMALGRRRASIAGMSTDQRQLATRPRHRRAAPVARPRPRHRRAAPVARPRPRPWPWPWPAVGVTAIGVGLI